MVSRESGLTYAEAVSRGQGSAHLDADPTYARRFVRKVSPYVSWWIARYTALAADHVTFASIGSGVLGGLMVGAGTLPLDLLAVVLLQLAYLLDVADGEVARIRGSAGRRGTYLDLIGHVLQNRALYAGASVSLIAVTDRAPWAIAAAVVTLAFEMPFGHYARMQVLGTPADHPEHGRPARFGPAGPGVLRAIRQMYRRFSVIWNYPASMNLFCVALLVDAARFASGASGALAIPVLLVLFGPSLAAKQILHAILLLRRRDW